MKSRYSGARGRRSVGTIRAAAVGGMAASALACGRIGIETLELPSGDFSARGGAAGATGSPSGGAGGVGLGGAAGGDLSGGAGAAGAGGEGGVVPTCTWTPFGAPEVITGLELTGAQYGPSLSADAFTLIVSEVAGGGVENLYTATRTDRGAVFSAAAAITELNISDDQGTAFLSYDGLTLYFYSIRPEGQGDRDLLFATRPDPSSTFSDAVLLEGVNTADREHLPTLTQHELTLVFSSNRADGAGLSDLWTAQRASRSDGFAAPMNLSEINTADDETGPALSPDGSTLFFVSDRAGGLGRDDIWMAVRPDPSSPFGPPVNVAEVNSDASEIDPALSADGRELFFSADTSGSREIWRSIRECL